MNESQMEVLLQTVNSIGLRIEKANNEIRQAVLSLNDMKFFIEEINKKVGK